MFGKGKESVYTIPINDGKYVITYEGRKFAFDIDAIKKLCFVSSNQKDTEKEITEVYGGEDKDDMELSSKIIREVKSQGDKQADNIMYDLVKLLMTRLLENGEVVRQYFPMDFSTSLALNTLLKWGVLVEVE